jgi:hypothetical protein
MSCKNIGQRASGVSLAIAVAFAFVILLADSTARAEDYFQITAVPTGGGAAVQASGNDLRNLVDDLTHTTGPFASLNGKAYTASLKAGGAKGPTAFTFSGAASGTDLTLKIPTQNFSKTFAAPTSDALQADVKQFIQSGADAYARLLRKIDEESATGLLDGNPRAATAVVAEDAFFRWGIGSTMSEDAKVSGENGAQLRFDLGAGEIRADDFNGSYVTASFGSDWRINDRVGLSIGIPFQYRSLTHTTAYVIGGEFGVPILIIPRHTDQGFAWQATPFVLGWGTFSGNLAAGGLLLGGGGVSDLNYRIGNFIFTMANEVTYNGGVPIDFEEFHLNTEVDQWIFKNGAKVTYAPKNQPAYVDAGFAYTTFLHNAAVDQYWTPFVSVGFKFGQYSGLRLSVRGNYGNGYADTGGEVTGYFSF